MSIAARQSLLRLAERDSTVNGYTIRTGRRTGWSFQINAPVVGTSVDLVVETAPADVEDQYSTLFTKSYSAATSETQVGTVSDGNIFLRARVTANVGTYWLEIFADSPWFLYNDSEDLQLVKQELRDWQDGKRRTLDRAERIILDELETDDAIDGLDADVNQPAFLPAMKQAIAAQADHLYGIYKLGNDSSPAARVSLRESSILAPGAMDHLRRFRPEASTVWRHR